MEEANDRAIINSIFIRVLELFAIAVGSALVYGIIFS